MLLSSDDGRFGDELLFNTQCLCFVLRTLNSSKHHDSEINDTLNYDACDYMFYRYVCGRAICKCDRGTQNFINHPFSHCVSLTVCVCLMLKAYIRRKQKII